MKYAKAAVAGLIAAISFAIPVVDNGVTPSEILGVVLAGLIGSGVTAAVPNRGGATMPYTSSHKRRHRS